MGITQIRRRVPRNQELAAFGLDSKMDIRIGRNGA
jgi:hypothetical protein